MAKHFKKALSMGLALALCLSWLPMSVFAAENAPEGKHSICGKQEHTHVATCYKYECSIEEHTHTATSCGAVYGDELHTHKGTCLFTTTTLTCGKTEHEHGEGCVYTDEEYTHSDDCYTTTTTRGELTCKETEHEHSEECGAEWNENANKWVATGHCAVKKEHSHTDSCYEQVTTEILNCSKTEHTHSADCCTLDVHTHNDECKETTVTVHCGKEEHTSHTSECTIIDWNCGKDAHTHGTGCNAEGKVLTCTKEEHTHVGTCYWIHEWDDGVVTKEATCEKEGVKTFTCDCGETKTESIPALSHSWSEWAVTKNPTTTEEGEATRICTRDGCLEAEIEELPKLNGPSQEDCTHPVHMFRVLDGNHVEWCSDCGKVFDSHPVNTQVGTCKWCTESEETDECEHLWTEFEMPPEKCGDSVTTWKVCEKCLAEEKVSEGDVVEHLKEFAYDGKDATCTEDGYTAYTHCESCGADIGKETIPAGHTAGEAVRENVVEATATTAGSHDEVVYCTVCEAELSRKTVTDPATETTDPNPATGTTDPVEPTDPVDPVDPVNPVDPIDPVNPVDPVNPTDPDPVPGGVDIDDNDIPLTDEPTDNEVEIDDTDAPLAALMTRAEFVNYLYVYEGSPAAELSDFTDVPEDYEYAMAIGWAQANGIAKGVSETEFAPEQIVTVGQAFLFLDRYAQYKGVEMRELAALAGKEDDEILDNADDALDEFFGGEE